MSNIKTNIKMKVNPEQYEKVWKNIIESRNRKYVQCDLETKDKYVGIDENGFYIEYTSEKSFKLDNFEEISAEVFINTNGSCDTSYLDYYKKLFEKISQDDNLSKQDFIDILSISFDVGLEVAIEDFYKAQYE